MLHCNKISYVVHVETSWASFVSPVSHEFPISFLSLKWSGLVIAACIRVPGYLPFTCENRKFGLEDRFAPFHLGIKNI